MSRGWIRDEQDDRDGRRNRHRGDVGPPVERLEPRRVADETEEADRPATEERCDRDDPDPAPEAVEAKHAHRGQRQGDGGPEHHLPGRPAGRERVVEDELADSELVVANVLVDGGGRDDPGTGGEEGVEPVSLGGAQNRRDAEPHEAKGRIHLERRRADEELGQRPALDGPADQRDGAERDGGSTEHAAHDDFHDAPIGGDALGIELCPPAEGRSPLTFVPWPC